MLLQAFDSIVSYHKPQFEWAKALAERNLPMLREKLFAIYKLLNFIAQLFPPYNQSQVLNFRAASTTAQRWMFCEERHCWRPCIKHKITFYKNNCAFLSRLVYDNYLRFNHDKSHAIFIYFDKLCNKIHRKCGAAGYGQEIRYSTDDNVDGKNMISHWKYWTVVALKRHWKEISWLKLICSLILWHPQKSQLVAIYIRSNESI